MTVTIVSQSMPNPQEYPFFDVPAGEYLEMAGGKLKFKPAVTGGIRKVFRLTWPALTATQLGNLRTACATALTTESTYTPIEGTNYTVICTGLPDITPVMVLGGTRYRVTIELSEAK